MSQDELDYSRRRAAEESAAALRSSSIAAATSHRDMARAYRNRIESARATDTSPTS
jgi:hypothetical protein